MHQPSSAQLPLPEVFSEAAEQAAQVGVPRQLPPMLRHYLELKRQYQDHLLLYQVGDFYEVFFDDAKVASQALGIRLTARHKDQPNPVPMCGVPVHAINNYLPKLLEQGLSCALMSQVDGEEKPKKGMVQREMTRIVTPGVRYDGDGLEAESSNYLAALCFSPRGLGALVYVDVSTGYVRLQEVESVEDLVDAFERIRPVECILPSTLYAVQVAKHDDWARRIREAGQTYSCHFVYRPFDRPNKEMLKGKIVEVFLASAEDLSPLEELGPEALAAVDSVLSYIEDVSFGNPPALSSFKVDEPQSIVFIDAATRRNLEILTTRIDGEKTFSLANQLNKTVTSMGARLLKQWLISPLCSRAGIEMRLDAVQEFFEDSSLLGTVREHLARVRDLERILSRITSGRAMPVDLGLLRDSIEVLPAIKAALTNTTSTLLGQLHERLDLMSDVFERLNSSLKDDLPLKLSDGGIVREGHNSEVDRLRSLKIDGKQFLLRLEEKERLETGIPGLKIKYNNVFGYFIEITKANLAKVPQRFERRQTLAGAERYTTPELKEYESSILSAGSSLVALEREIFVEIRQWLSTHAQRIQLVSEHLSMLDVLASFALVARANNYTRPIFAPERELKIEVGRHPVVELMLGQHNFVANGTLMNGEQRRFAVLTGPNMGGKSTYLRQVGLIQLLAQAGCFVPASKAELPIVDRIFTRIGASDDISRGDSTFMVEMREAATIVRKATSRSMVLIDEIGRGTATADGLAIATAIAEWLHQRLKCLTVFATHFHELTTMADKNDGVFCLSVGVVEDGSNIRFTHKIEESAADRSYGIEVARLAGLPEPLLKRAEEVLQGSEMGTLTTGTIRTQVTDHRADLKSQLVIDRLNELAPERMTPIEALVELERLKNLCADKDKDERSS